MIDPKELIETLSVEELCETAESFFRILSKDNPLIHMGKPFSDINGVSDTLQNMSHLLSELQLGKSMTVLDFAAGTCWLSRFLNQLRCRTISCDVSETALRMGQELFSKFPPIGDKTYEPQFLKFDGHKIDLPSESVDRIICHDGLHHIPNQEEVIAELARVLQTGGIAAFSEPGRFHSQSLESQHDMKTFNVLENDIVLSEIFTAAQKYGFTDIKIKPICNTSISLQDYQQLTSNKRKTPPEKSVTKHIRHLLDYRLVFFLYKGDFISDSRCPIELSHVISSTKKAFSVKAGETFLIPLKISNTGKARWMASNIDNIGVVFIGTHLYDSSDNLIRGGARQGGLSRDKIRDTINSGESIEQTIEIEIHDAGEFKISIDLHSEQICWFKALGSEPLELDISVLTN
ncbi:MAG: class I SAM-dependent methyltransferase [Halioglobus sp.]|jgi:ubiquinone/menaquinone biosynthesis C-methylase UbiE